MTTLSKQHLFAFNIILRIQIFNLERLLFRRDIRLTVSF